MYKSIFLSYNQVSLISPCLCNLSKTKSLKSDLVLLVWIHQLLFATIISLINNYNYSFMDSILVWVYKRIKNWKKTKLCHLELGTLCDSFLISYSLSRIWMIAMKLPVDHLCQVWRWLLFFQYFLTLEEAFSFFNSSVFVFFLL